MNEHDGLHTTLQHMLRLHPWYGELLKEHGIRLPAAGGIRLEELPLMTAETLERFYYSQPPREEPGLSVYRTSGTSTGVRKAIYYSEEDDIRYMEAKTASFRGWLRGSLAGGKALADLGTGHAASTALRIFDELGMVGEAIDFASPIEQHIRKLHDFRPDLLYTMPSILEAIAHAAPDPRSFGLKRIIIVGEIASAAWQDNMAARFGLSRRDLLDTYGSIEIGAMAAYDHDLGMYVLADGLYGEALPAERIDGGLEPLRADEGVLVLTSTVRKLFPAIRFVTYDVVRDFGIRECGGKVRYVFSGIVKRIGKELKHGEKISLYDIEEAVSRHVKDAAVRVMARDNRLTVFVGSRNADDAMLQAVRRELEISIAEIGKMIEGGLLRGIEVIRLEDAARLPSGTVKSKKIYP